jgi:hypothetical protein
MRSQKQIEASRRNGARSRGPLTLQGKYNSAHHATRHGLLANTVVLEGESEDRFQALLAAFTAEFQPTTETELTLVETMTVARWHQLRIWGAQKTSLDRDIALTDPAVGPPQVRVLFALRGSSESACPPELLLRYDLAFGHQFTRALRTLTHLRAQRAKLTASPVPSEFPAGESSANEIAPAKRTQEVIENKTPPTGENPRNPGKLPIPLTRAPCRGVQKILSNHLRGPRLRGPSLFGPSLPGPHHRFAIIGLSPCRQPPPERGA